MWHIIVKGHKNIENVCIPRTDHLHTLLYQKFFYPTTTGNKTSMLEYLLKILKCV